MRESTALDASADDYVDKLVSLSPLTATELGISGSDHLLDDFSPEGHERMVALSRQMLDQISTAELADETDEITSAAMTDRLGLEQQRFEAGDHLRNLDNISSPLQLIRDVFALMPTDTDEQWHNIAGRMKHVEDALDGYQDTLRLGVERNIVPAVRAVVDGIAQCKELSGTDSLFVKLAGDAPETMREEVLSAAQLAGAAYHEFGKFLATELAGRATPVDAVGREFYARASHEWVGSVIDLDETYEWGVESLAEITAEQDALAREIAGPGATVKDAIAVLDADPVRQIQGTDALKEWMQQTADEAIAALHGRYFDIPEPVRTVEACIAPQETGGIYYTQPAQDFSRPGRMWWSVPPGVISFTTWAEKTTVYHEGVPGHHLQLGQAVHNSDELNKWRRLISWTSGHGEGWALYSERLMEEFGFLDDPGDRFGMLDAQRLRAVRVVIDLGLHLGKPAFERYGGGVWDYEKGWALLRDNVAVEENQLRFEWHRYLSWPGQAPSYRIGQRVWEQIRADASKRDGFDLLDFHTRALNLGSVPLDVLRGTLLA